jgi:hypothetical protein
MPAQGLLDKGLPPYGQGSGTTYQYKPDVLTRLIAEEKARE